MIMALSHVKQAKHNANKSKRFQYVFERIKKERPWDIRPGSSVYTTAKEKYLIKLINEGTDISDETIDHVVGGCYRIHHLMDTSFCWFGFILTTKEYMRHCKYADQNGSNSKVNNDLWSSQGTLFYPVSMLVNPFGEWQPREKTLTKEMEEVHELVKLRWPSPLYEDELHKYTLKHLMTLIENGNVVSHEVKEHVVFGCKSDFHTLNDNYKCCYGFVLKKDEVPICPREIWFQNVNENLSWIHGELHFVMNPRHYEHTGTRSIPVRELRFRNWLTSKKLTDKCITCTEATKPVYDRIIHRDLVSPTREKVQITWTEQFLIDQMNSHNDIPSEVIAHALEGCYTLCHVLTKKYACCRGYIVESDTVLQHDFKKCFTKHQINKDLWCLNGRVYHRCDEIPMGCKTPPPAHASSLRKTKTLNSAYAGELPRVRRHPRPAPPPLDHLDELQNFGEVIFARNEAQANVRHNHDRNGGNVEAVVQPAAADERRRYQAAPPPPEFDI